MKIDDIIEKENEILRIKNNIGRFYSNISIFKDLTSQISNYQDMMLSVIEYPDVISTMIDGNILEIDGQMRMDLYSELSSYGTVLKKQNFTQHEISNVTKVFKTSRNFKEIFGRTPTYVDDGRPFMGSKKLEEFHSDTITKVDTAAFYECSNLSVIDLPNLKHSEPIAFAGTAITSMYLPNSITYFTSGFAGCRNLISIDISNLPMKCIQGQMFMNCVKLQDIVGIPETALSIGNHAFFGCTSLKYLKIPSQISAYGIGGSVFASVMGSPLSCTIDMTEFDENTKVPPIADTSASSKTITFLFKNNETVEKFKSDETNWSVILNSATVSVLTE